VNGGATITSTSASANVETVVSSAASYTGNVLRVTVSGRVERKW
jgi:ribosomal protein L31